MLWFALGMKYIWCITVFFLPWFFSGCTLNFKAKELELETIPPITYELDTINLFVLKGI